MDIADVMDASAVDSFSDFDLTGEFEDTEEQPLTEEEATSDDSLDTSEQEPAQEESTEQSEEVTEPEFDLTAEVLRLKGIKDPSKIKFQDESGAIIERDWNDLSNIEQLNILANLEDPERDLDDDEIQLINTLRQNNLTPQQYILAIQQDAATKAVNNYLQSQSPTYEIDLYSDDELFVIDLLEKVGEENITDDEIRDYLEKAKSNEELYNRQVAGLRQTYKNLEDQRRYSAQQEQIQQAEQQYQDFSNQVLGEISGFSKFANQEVQLSTDDKNDLANYLLTRRDTGISDFYKDVQDPKVATLAAFWLLRGPEVLAEMENQVKAAYQRGFSIGKAQNTPSVSPKTPKVVVQQPKSVNSSNEHLSAFGLEDDSYLR